MPLDFSGKSKEGGGVEGVREKRKDEVEGERSGEGEDESESGMALGRTILYYTILYSVKWLSHTSTLSR